MKKTPKILLLMDFFPWGKEDVPKMQEIFNKSVNGWTVLIVICITVGINYNMCPCVAIMPILCYISSQQAKSTNENVSFIVRVQFVMCL